jgi:hypothetical protein
MFTKLFVTSSVLLFTHIHALTVHLVPHTHDDVGWLKTVDEYYSGTNNTIQHAAVRNVINAVVMSLKKNPERKFTYVEQAFFQRWWRELNDDDKNATRALVHSGQLNFVNGGWCMHDEAAVHYVDMVDQTTLGHRLLKEAFGDDGIVTVGWQLDPFGHSATQAALLSAEAGFDGLFFGRIDYQDLNIRHKEKRNEFIWRASPSLGDDAAVFSGLSGEYNGNYGPPSGFNWHGDDEPIEDNKNLETYNVPARVNEAIYQAEIQGNMTRGEHIMWTMGSDFNYEWAETWFINMDKLIKAVNADGRITMKYSSPAEYVEAKRSEKNVTWPVKTDDFFPYADGPHQFWSGYFTSRPALKGYVRTTSALFGAVRAVQSVAVASTLSSLSQSSLQLIEEALGVAQHHDAVSGTAKQHVAFDYAKRLAHGVEQASSVFSDSVNALRTKNRHSMTTSTISTMYQMCLRLNETVCTLTNDSSQSTIEIVLWNMLGQARTELVTVPIAPDVTATVTDATGKTIPSQTYDADETVNNYARNTQETKTVLSFHATLPALGYSAHTIHYSKNEQDHKVADEVKHEVADKEDMKLTIPLITSATPPTTVVVLENEHIAVHFSSNGLISSMVNKKTNISILMEQTFCYYVSNEGDKKSGQKSGAYIFRPKTNACYPIQNQQGGADIEVSTTGPVVQEIRQIFSPYLTQTVRLAANAEHVDLIHTVGAIPFQSTTANKTLEQCVSWRQTGGCDPHGQREPQHDLKCDKAVPAAASGYCECYNGRQAQLSGCGHLGFTCKQACMSTEGREIVARFNTSISSGSTILTDSNGREMLERTRNFRPSWNFSNTEEVAGNYYPINSAVALSDKKTAQMTLLVDRACGAGSMSDGELEVMIHRRVLQDDGRGVGEPLNETRDTGSYAGKYGGAHTGPGIVVRGTHRLLLNEPSTAASVWRPLADRTYSPAQMLIKVDENVDESLSTSSSSSSSLLEMEDSFMNVALPPNVQLMTLQALTETTLLVRLSHQFGLGEDAALSQPVTLDLKEILSPTAFNISQVEEVSLTNSQPKTAVMERRSMNLAWKTEGAPAQPHPWRTVASNMKEDSTSVTLGPLEIKTFKVTLG